MRRLASTIDAVVVFRGNSKPLPYKFRYTDSSGQSREVLVSRIFLAEKNTVAGSPVYSYDCQSTIDGAERRYQLKYHPDKCFWELHKI